MKELDRLEALTWWQWLLCLFIALEAAFFLLLLTGCVSPEQRIADAVKALNPVVAELPALGPGGDVTVVFIMPDFGRPFWAMPFTVSDVASRKVYVILVPRGGCHVAGESVGGPAGEAAPQAHRVPEE